MVFCETLQEFDIDELITHCPDCLRFFVLCCGHPNNKCHHFRLVFTDGSCFNNGRGGATAGIGIAIGESGVEDQWSIPVDNTVDSRPKRTSQRAELLASLEGLRQISKKDGGLQHATEQHDANASECWVVATDSEYVVKGMIEWLPVWKRNGWRTSRGTLPSNLDLFQRLDSLIDQYERMHHVRIGFWHIPREFNELADSLARRAAQSAVA